MILYLLTLLIFIITLQSKQLYMAEVFRHGARYPLHNIYDGKQTAAFHGKLTEVGMRQQYLLGSYLQAEYALRERFVNATLKPRQVEVFTLGAERCEESAYAQVLGLFGFGSGEVIDQNIDPALLQPPFETIFPSNLNSQQAPNDYALQFGFQPVPIRFGDNFFPKCDNQNSIWIKRAQKIAPRVAQLQAEHTIFVEEMKKLFNLTLQQSNLGGLTELYDTLTADMYLGRKIPEKFTQKDYQKLDFIQSYLFTLVNEEEPARVFNAPFISAMLQNMQKVINGQLQQKKLSLYSAHDSNLVPLMVYYNLTSAECLRKLYHNETVKENCAVPVPFASSIIFELHQDDTQQTKHFVKVRYNGKYYNLCGKNSTQCEFGQFAAKSKAHLMDFTKECAKKKANEMKKEDLVQE